jgi:hypothetical protein
MREKYISMPAEMNVKRKSARLDFVIGIKTGYVFLEVDEHQHK